MPGIRVDHLLASTAIDLLLALPTTGTFAGSENDPAAGATPPQQSQADNANKPAVSDPGQKASNDTPADTSKPQETAAPASNSAEKTAGEAKPMAASDSTAAPAAAPAGQVAQSAGGEAKPDAKPEAKSAPSTETAQPR